MIASSREDGPLMDESAPVGEELSVRELSDRSGQSVRTIHYYISEGLLPPPRGAKRNATYSSAHLARLRLIAALRDEGLALAAIRARVAPLGDEQVFAVVRTLDTYLNAGHGQPITTLGMIEAAVADEMNLEPPPAFAPSAPLDESVFDWSARGTESAAHRDVRESAADYVSRVLGRSKPAPSRPLPPQARPTKVSGPRGVSPEAWYHFPIADGIELRVREDRYHQSRGRLHAVVDGVVASLNRYGLSLPDDRDSYDS
jgi:DNA-binding transcriptional MerR regulator